MSRTLRRPAFLRTNLPALLLPALLLVVFAAHDAHAQHSVATRPDAWGRRFWLAFPPNTGSGVNEITELHLAIRALEPATVTITSFDRDSSITVKAGTGTSATIVKLERSFAGMLDLAPLELRSRKSFLVESTADVTISALSLRTVSSDAMLVLPEGMLGSQYVVLAWPNGLRRDGDSLTYDMASQFAIIATEDGTSVTITPGESDAVPETLTMARGDVYLGEAPLGRPADVSGASIRSSRPVAVLAGNRRAGVPSDRGNFRDHLLEQLIPIERWGSEAVATPLYAVAGVTDTARLRVIAAEAGTLSVDGREYPLRACGVLELPLDRPMHLRADVPFEAAVFERSGGYDADRIALLADPSMMLVVPTRALDTVAHFESFDHDYFFEHYATIVATAAVPGLELDGGAVAPRFVRVGETELYVAHMPLAAGSHVISGMTPFAVYAYGFGEAISYAYPAGFSDRSSTSRAGADAEPARRARLTVSPMPATHAVRVELAGYQRGTVTIEIIDGLGKRWQSEVLNGRTDVLVQFAGAPGGIYICRAVDGSGVIATIPVIVAR